MFVKITTKEQERLTDLSERAKTFGITVLDRYKEAGMNLMVRFQYADRPVNVANITRFADMVESHERAKALEEYLAKGGTVKSFDPDLAQGVKRSTTSLKRKAPGGGRKAEPIQTGDAKFDMYLNALPEPVRVLVIPNGLDPRELYKEYRALKKEGLIAKYCKEVTQ